MSPTAQGYTGDRSSVVRRTHEAFGRWKREHVFPEALSGVVLERMRLAVHEWIVHWVQHADFAEREPQIYVDVWPEDGRLHGTVRDNSTGFTAAAAGRDEQPEDEQPEDEQPEDEQPEDDLRALAERRVEVALVLDVAEQATYRRTPDGDYVLSLSVAPAPSPRTGTTTSQGHPAETEGLADWQIILSQAG